MDGSVELEGADVGIHSGHLFGLNLENLHEIVRRQCTVVPDGIGWVQSSVRSLSP